MTQTDIDNGRAILVVGFASIEPAEFTVIHITLPTRDAALIVIEP